MRVLFRNRKVVGHQLKLALHDLSHQCDPFYESIEANLKVKNGQVNTPVVQCGDIDGLVDFFKRKTMHA